MRRKLATLANMINLNLIGNHHRPPMIGDSVAQSGTRKDAAAR